MKTIKFVVVVMLALLCRISPALADGPASAETDSSKAFGLISTRDSHRSAQLAALHGRQLKAKEKGRLRRLAQHELWRDTTPSRETATKTSELLSYLANDFSQ